MKKIVFLSLVLNVFLSTIIYGARKVVLVEVFTSTTCPPCASANPYFDNWLSNYGRRDSVAVIKYHVWWPATGDPYYAANTADVKTRNSYYNPSYVPHGYVDGNIDGQSDYVTWPTLTTSRSTTISPFEISITGKLTMDTGRVYVKIRSDGTTIPAGTLILHTVIVENKLNYTGSNGDPVHQGVMRKMYPSASGQTFTIALNDSVIKNVPITWNQDWNFDNCKVIAFVQIQSTKAILQAATKSIEPMMVIIPRKPDLLLPLEGATKIPFMTTLSWAAAQYAYWYQIQFSADSLFDTTVVDTIVVDPKRITVTNLKDSTTYFWRVKSYRDGLMSEWSSTRRFSTPKFTALLSQGWNLVSVPRLVDQWDTRLIFPPASSDAISYNSNYTISYTLKVGEGYWLKFENQSYVGFDGGSVTSDSVNLFQGWNIIGSISYPIPITSISSDPPGIIDSPVWAFMPGSGYYKATNIEPSKGYWIKAKQAGKLFLSTAGKK